MKKAYFLILFLVTSFIGCQNNDEVDEIDGNVEPKLLITGWGDSLTAGPCANEINYLKVLQSLLGSSYNVVNCGVGGEDAATIAARQGGVSAYIKQGFILPQTTDWVVISEYSFTGGNTFTNKYEKLIMPLLQGDDNSVNPCYLQGTECTLKYDATNENWSIRRNTASDHNMIIPENTPLFFYGSKAYRNPYAQIIWIGQNTGGHSSNAQLIEYYRQMIDFSGCTNTIVIGLHTETAVSRAELEKDMFEAFGQRYINWREYISSREAFYDAALTPTQADLNAIADGSLPPSFWSNATDNVHLNATAYTLLGKLIYKRFQLLGII